ncbi:MAG: hypothetical protein HY023_01260 [Chloroflexi bacterium]|nr:hypothetical protein [Chloroflexota bacterium]
MKRLSGPVVWGVLLIVIGLLLLAENFKVFGELAEPLWAVIFAASGVLFFAAYFTQGRGWWFLIPAFVLLGLAAVVLSPRIGLSGNAGGSVFLWAIAAAFWSVFAVDRRQWWPIIPAGVMTTVGLMPLASGRLRGEAIGALFFVGLGLTFALLYLLRARYKGATAWAVWPAGACLGMGLVVGAFGPLEKFWPVIFLILPGLFLLYNALRPRRADSGPQSPLHPPKDSAP